MKLATKGILSLAAITAATSAIALTGVSPANAFTFKITKGALPDATQFAPAGGATVINFDSFATGAISSANLGGLNLTTTGSTSIGTDGNIGDEDKYLSIGKKKGSKPGSATFSATVDRIPYLGLYWSEIKATDKLVLGLFNGDSFSRTGAEIVKDAADMGKSGQEFYLNFYESDVSKRFTSLKITSTGSVVDNVAYRVPTPALLPGLIGMGLAAWRKRKGEEAEQAEA